MAEMVRFRGLREFDRALGKANKDLRTILRRDLKEIAAVVAVEARAIAEDKGLRRSGDLISHIQPFAYTGRAGVRSSAIHRGYAYPRRLEFEGRGADEFGPRASLLPAVEAKQEILFASAEALLDRLVVDLAT
jgi:hypothetical protein